jgi:Xaa-Pro aminopeptidase
MISQKEHQQRREAFFAQMSPNSIAVFPTAPEYFKTADPFHLFHPDNDFYYLTGFDEPEALAVLLKDDERGEQYILFNRPNDADIERWVGKRTGQTEAKEQFLADESYPITELLEKLPDFIQDKTKLYHTFGRYSDFDVQLNRCLNIVRNHVRGGIKIPDTLVNAENLLFEMRLIKSETELDLTRKAADISARAHIRAMRASKPGLYEYQLAAEVLYEFYRSGCSGAAYPSIVGSGINACTLHYEANNRQMQDGELVLIDAGGKYQHYCADITRTLPVNGRFSGEQRALYDVVLRAQQAAIEEIRAGKAWNKMGDAAAYTITEGLVDLKILKGSVQELYEQDAYRPFYMHRVGHWLGMDVHDVGRYKLHNKWRSLEPGMITTVEPGLYITPETPGVHKKWWGMGIRIEDDIVVTRDGHEVITSGAPKTMDEIEQLMSQN